MCFIPLLYLLLLGLKISANFLIQLYSKIMKADNNIYTLVRSPIEIIYYGGDYYKHFLVPDYYREDISNGGIVYSFIFSMFILRKMCDHYQPSCSVNNMCYINRRCLILETSSPNMMSYECSVCIQL